jgi:hypothetical protein
MVVPYVRETSNEVGWRVAGIAVAGWSRNSLSEHRIDHPGRPS